MNEVIRKGGGRAIMVNLECWVDALFCGYIWPRSFNLSDARSGAVLVNLNIIFPCCVAPLDRCVVAHSN